jgi:hypothetical protein
VKPAVTRGEQYQKGGSQQGWESLYGAVDGKLCKVCQLRYDIPLCAECCPSGTLNTVLLLCCLNGTVLQDGTFKTFAIVLDASNAKDLQANPERLRRVGVAWGISPEFWTEIGTSEVSII